jgi:hypothetical protein
MAIHNLDGAKLLADLGFTRVVLARELSLKEIETITRGCGIETEVFIHGALCYSYSGLCLFSSHLLGRSGNRGRCAYCCRQTFSQGRQDGGEPPVPPASSGHNPYRSHPAGSKILPFSMKDFAVGPHLDQLLDAGVTSLKIEGRMRSTNSSNSNCSQTFRPSSDAPPPTFTLKMPTPTRSIRPPTDTAALSLERFNRLSLNRAVIGSISIPTAPCKNLTALKLSSPARNPTASPPPKSDCRTTGKSI